MGYPLIRLTGSSNDALGLPARLGTALLFGGLSTLAHGPIHAWWFALLCLAGWILSIRPRQPLHNLTLGFAFGIGWFTAGGWWIGAGLWRFTEAGAVGAIAITTAVVSYLSLFPALAGLLIGLARAGATWPARCLLTAAGWTVTAWLRGTLFGGLPWMSVGTGQLTGPLSPWAPMGGALLVEFLALFVAAALAETILASMHAPRNRRRALGAAGSIGLVILAGLPIKTLEWTHPAGELTVRLAQGDLAQQDKFSVEGLRRASEVYGADIAGSHADLTILPETAFPMTWDALPRELRLNVHRFAAERRTAVMLGALQQEPSGSMTNDLLLIRPGSPTVEPDDARAAQPDDRYVKQHLLFIGEFLPQSLSWLGRRLNVAFSSLTSSVEDNHLLTVGPARIAPAICFESFFGAAIAARARDANLLVNISNFAWFTGTWAADQELDVIRMRSLETGRWTARAANSGISALVDEKGAVVDALPQDEPGVLDGRIGLRAGLTPYDRAGDLPILLSCIVCLVIGAIGGKVRSSAGRRQPGDLPAAGDGVQRET